MSNNQLTINDIKERLRQAIEEIGIVISIEDISEDIDLREYIEDSMQFISTIVQIEKTFTIEFPDEILHFDTLMSYNAFSNIILELVEKNAE